jgi:uncharacterized protein (TIGR02597 family)
MRTTKSICRRQTTAGLNYTVILIAFFLCRFVTNVSFGAVACSEPTGSYTTTFLTNSDSCISIPFTAAPLFCGTVQSTSSDSITVQGAPGWTNGQWAIPSTPNGYYPNYFVLTSGTNEGAYFIITTNTADTLFTDLSYRCYDLTGVNTGDSLAIIPFWTLGTIFPGGSGITPAVSRLNPSSGTQLIINPPCSYCSLPSPVYYFYNGHWRSEVSSPSSNYGDVVIFPDQSFLVRQPSNAPPPFTIGGNVVQYAQQTCLVWEPSYPTYIWVADYHSTTQTLDQVNLAMAFAASNPGTNPPAINDLLFVYDNTAMKMNKAPAHIYFYNVDHWADLNNPPYDVDHGCDPVFVPGIGVTVLKQTNSPPVWVIPP